MNPEPCHSFDTYKGVFSPKCGCYPCWETYFKANATKTFTAALAMDKYGAQTVTRVQGNKYVKALKLFLKNEEEKGHKII